AGDPRRGGQPELVAGRAAAADAGRVRRGQGRYRVLLPGARARAGCGPGAGERRPPGHHPHGHDDRRRARPDRGERLPGHARARAPAGPHRRAGGHRRGHRLPALPRGRLGHRNRRGRRRRPDAGDRDPSGGKRMKVGIGLPTMLPGTPGSRLAEWARAAEAAGFASLNVTDRMAYENYDPFAALAVAAAMTHSIPLRRSAVLGPWRPPGLLAKSALTLDRLSDGRFELGLGVGSRPDDYAAAGVDIHRRGELLNTQLKQLTSYWQDAAARTAGAIGP